MNDDFEVSTSDGDGVIGLDHTGVLWFNACCDDGNVQLTVDQGRELRVAVDAFLAHVEGEGRA